MAQQSCTFCFGLGLRAGRGGAKTPCHCVYRSIFRACYARFRQCAGHAGYMGRVDLDRIANSGRATRYNRNATSQVFGLRKQEFVADVILVARRTLTTAEHRLFKYHFLLGADWKLCCRKLAINRGQFFHAVYRIQQKLGKVFATLPFSRADRFAGASRAAVS